MEENQSSQNTDQSTSPVSKNRMVLILVILTLLGVALFLFRDKLGFGFLRPITMAEVAQHATGEDCWLAIEGKVYDVTDFVSKHPGEEAILFGCGRDATSMFNNRPDGTSHSDKARTQLSNFQIGTLSD